MTEDGGNKEKNTENKDKEKSVGDKGEGDKKEVAGPVKKKNIGQCCNTCDSLKAAYQKEGLAYYDILEKSEQCKAVQGCNVREL
jgi:hypothetical protein